MSKIKATGTNRLNPFFFRSVFKRRSRAAFWPSVGLNPFFFRSVFKPITYGDNSRYVRS